MKKVKVRLTGKGTEEEPYTVNLPTWTMKGDPDYVTKECEVYLPEDEVLPNGKINQARIRAKYKKNWSSFNASNVEL